MPEEVASLLPDAPAAEHASADFFETEIGGFDVVIASAGLGKVRAAVSASLLLERWNCRALVSAGTAGGLSGTQPMQVVVATEPVQHDYGRSRGLGELELFRPGIPPLPEYSHIDHVLAPSAGRVNQLKAVTRELDFVVYGRYASGDTFVNDTATRTRLESLGAIAVDMECCAIAQVAEDRGVPWLVAKGISDDASTTSHDDFLAGIAEASRRSGQVVEALLPILLER